MCEQHMTLFRAGEASLMHMPIQKQIQETHGYDQPILFFKDHPSVAYEICMRTEEKLTMAYVIVGESMESMTQHVEAMKKNYKTLLESKDCALQAKEDALQAKDAVIKIKEDALRRKDECIEQLNAELCELKSQLARANNEILA
jgi:hypothetical protein